MIRLGYIRLTDKVYFEYCRFKKPDPNNFKYWISSYFRENLFTHDTQEYEASKQLIEVSNVNKIKKEWYYDNIGIKCPNTDWTVSKRKVLNNQPCKAEVNGTAKIIKLL